MKLNHTRICNMTQWNNLSEVGLYGSSGPHTTHSLRSFESVGLDNKNLCEV